VRISTHEQIYSNNNSVTNKVNYANYFGTGVDGSVTVSSSAQISSSTSPAGLNNTQLGGEFGDIIVKNFQDLTINSGVFYSPLRACRGLIIYCTGDLTVNGTISMTGKGGGVANKIAAPLGIAPVTDTRFDLLDASLYFNNFSASISGKGIPTHWNWAPSGSAWFSNYKIRVPLSGSVAGGTGGSGNVGAGAIGTAGIFCCGGGGGGGTGSPNFSNSAGSGGRGTIFTGGAGGQGSHYAVSFTPPALFEAGGGNSTGSGGGAGNPSSAGSGSPSATPGVGGLLCLIVRGNVNINGTISNNGSNGGTGTGLGGGTGGGGGGGSGGGRTLIIYGGTYTNTGTVVANGGSGGPGPAPCSPGPCAGGSGGAGGAGSITLRKVHT